MSANAGQGVAHGSLSTRTAGGVRSGSYLRAIPVGHGLRRPRTRHYLALPWPANGCRQEAAEEEGRVTSQLEGRKMSAGKALLGIPVALLVSAGGALAATTITLQDGFVPRPGQPIYWGTSDAWLEEANTRNYGGDMFLEIQWYNGRSDTTVLRFELSGVIPNYQRIVSARLMLYYSSASSMQDDNAIELKPYRVTPTMPWFENIYAGTSGHGVNWKYRDDAQTQQWTGQDGAWSDKIDDGNTTRWIQDSDGEVGGDPPPARPGDALIFTVTNSVKAWYEQGAANQGFSMFAVNFVGGGTTCSGLFPSRNHGTDWARPKLEITYEGALLPLADAGGFYAVAWGEMVLLDGTGSYDPDGGSIVAWQWDLDYDSQYDDASGSTVNVTYDYLLSTLGLTPGWHNIGLKVTDDESATDTDDALLWIAPGDGDFEPDGDVDLADFAAFQRCFAQSPIPTACQPGNMNEDGAIDLADLDLFVGSLDASGPH